MPARRPSRTAALHRVAAVAVLAAVFAVGIGPVAHPTAVRAGTAETMESQILGWVNQSRTQLGRVPLRSYSALTTLAGDRVAINASTGVLSHTISGCLSCQLTSRGIQWYSYGEVIAWTSYPWGDQAAQSLFNAWKNSPSHWSLLMSSKFNYIGVGVAYRSANATSWGAIVMTESVDHTKPTAQMGTASRSSTTVSWTWKGADVKLQTHTAGLKNFDVQYRVDSGTWSTIRSATTTTSLSLTGRAHGHDYGLRVRSRDNRSNLSSYTAELRIWVP